MGKSMASNNFTISDIQVLVQSGKRLEAIKALQQRMIFSELKHFEYDSFGRVIAEIAQNGVEGIPTVRLAVLGGYTTAPLVSAIRCDLLAEGFLPVIYEAEYDTFRQEIFDLKSALYSFKPDLILLAVGPYNVRYFPPAWSTAAQIEETYRLQIEEWQGIWRALNESFSCPVIQHTITNPNYNFVGPVELNLEWSAHHYLMELNQKLIRASTSNVYWLDVARLASRVGEWNWHDERLYHHGKLGFSSKFLSEYSRLFMGVFRALWGRTKKCLVLDLDNTLWGGVVGEDGLEGIRLGSGSAIGEAYFAFCSYIKELKNRGVTLAVCSKNDEKVARTIFEKHPYMPLTLDDISFFCCNWDDKASNLLKIASALNVAVSSLVFVDDDPAECDLVRQALPSVAVLKLPEDPAIFSRCVDGRHYFDTVRLSEEDRRRSASYAARAKAETLKTSVINIESYLQQLEMSALFCRATSTDLSRLAQMELKTNQFNLTTRRYTEKMLADFLASRDHFIFTCQLQDKFVDHGIVSSLVTIREGGVLRINSWLMSCRVFSRTLERFIMDRLRAFSRDFGIRRLIGEYRRTESNQKFSNLYRDLGFDLMSTDSTTALWALEIGKETRLLKSPIRDRVVAAQDVLE